MSFTNIKLKGRSEAGFTIVELLIVVVVIAILAAITIVSYNGITARANSSSAAATAASFQKKAELYNSDGPTLQYPSGLAALTGASASSSYYIVSGAINITAGIAPTSANGKNTIEYQPCGNNGTSTAPTTIAGMTAITGGIITYYDFANTTTKTINIGNTTTGGNPNIACIAATS